MLYDEPERFSAVVVNFTNALGENKQFYDWIMRLLKPIPIVLLCGRGNENLIISSIKNGVKDCLLKDELTDEHLVKTVLQAIEVHKFEMMNLQFQKRLQERANYDFLTGTLNRYRFSELYECEIARAYRCKHPLSVAMIDIDDFKHINDTYGHKVGDKALIAVSDLLKTHLRKIDLIGRFGGDEFVVAMPETDFTQAQNIFRKIYQALSEFNQLQKLPSRLSISVGISSSDSEYESLIERADEAMYQSKMAHKTPHTMLMPPQV